MTKSFYKPMDIYIKIPFLHFFLKHSMPQDMIMDSWSHRKQFSLKWSEVGKTVKESEIDQIRKQLVYWNPAVVRTFSMQLWVSHKNGYFTVRLTVRGGGVNPVGPDHKQMWKCCPILSLKFASLILKTQFISLWRVLKMHFSLSLRLCYTSFRPFCKRAAASRKEE